MRCAYASDAPSTGTATKLTTVTVLGASLAPADDRNRPQHDEAVEVSNQLSTEADQRQIDAVNFANVVSGSTVTVTAT